MYVSNDFAIREKILRTNYDNSNADHFVKFRTEIAIRKKYYWNNMFKNIVEYCKICSICQRVRVHHYKFYENLFLISSNGVELFTTVTLNFIIDMLFAKNFYIGKTYNVILVLMNKFIKHATYIGISKILNAKSFADLI